MPHKILVVGSATYAQAVKELGKTSFYTEDFIKNPKKFSLVLFTGGADIHPSFYGHMCPELRPLCFTDIDRDLKEAYIYNVAKENGVKMAGICRGLQFLNVMNGGKMMHHLDNHENVLHEFECLKDDKIREVNSFHHQMIIPGKDCKVVGWSPTKRSKIYYGNRDKVVEWKGPELEAAIFPKSKACGVQWHPEWMHRNTPGRNFFTNMVSNLLELPLEVFVSMYTGAKKKNGSTGIS